MRHPARSSFQLLGNDVGWQMDALGWFFAVITVGAAGFSAAFAAGEWGAVNGKQGLSLRWLYGGLQINVLAMLLLLSSADFISLFIGWELTSWSGLILMLLAGGEAIRAALRYIVYALAGGMAVFAGMLVTQAHVGSLQFAALSAAAPNLPNTALWSITLLFVLGFAVKMAMLPFHLWQPPAYAYSPGPASAFLGSISARMGLFGIALVAIKLIGLGQLLTLSLWRDVVDLRDILLWVAALTAILPTYVAMRQNDARLLLSWHGVGQGGYMLLGLMIADSLGNAGGLLHVFNYASYQVILLLAVFAVIHRTGTADLNRLGGLVARMPLTFLAMLVGIIGLAGLPPMNGFVSKWMIYRSLVSEGMPLLFVATVISTLGTVLSVYKLLHNTFLGQLRLEHVEVKEAPWSMTVPMLLVVRARIRDRCRTGPGPEPCRRGTAGDRSGAGGLYPRRHRITGRQSRHALDQRHPVCRVRYRCGAVLWPRRTQQACPSAGQLRRRAFPDRRRALPVQRQFLRRPDAPHPALVPQQLRLAGIIAGVGGRRREHAGTRLLRTGQPGAMGAGRHNRRHDLDDVACTGLSFSSN